MAFRLEDVVPWGRSFDEYRRMFDLSDSDLTRSILGCADGPAALNAVLSAQGGEVISCDPLYCFSRVDIESRIQDCFDVVLQQARENEDGFLWSAEIPNVEGLGRVRREAMDVFLADFIAGSEAGRYVTGELPALPFTDRQFDLAICSHFLFLYDSLGLEFHLRSVLELLRVAEEVRIFPLVQLDAQRSPYVNGVIDEAGRQGYTAKIVPVAYEFQRGASEMLRIWQEY